MMERIERKRVFPTIGDVVVLLVLFLLSQLVLGAILGVTGIVQPEISASELLDAELYMNEQEALGRYVALVYPLSMLSALILMWLYARLRGGRGSIKIKCSIKGFDPNVILTGVLWLIAAQIMLDPLAKWLPASESVGVGRGLWAWVSVMLFAPVLEELLCRGVLFETLNNRWGVITSIILSAIFFGVIHADVLTAIVAVVAGAIFGVLYVRTSSIFSTIIIHSINNGVAFALMCFGISDMTFYELLGGGVLYYVVYAVAVAIFLIASLEAYIKVFKKKKSVEE